ncbi:MAG: efflux RND transporter periplasmic adaptor subunit [Candidatus Competibacteraceae bacterium]|nr:efflux RND transporter periplasmic adaptor subunit [Candidatus Competibacteraceae bacterium]
MRLFTQFGIAALLVMLATVGWYWVADGKQSDASAQPSPPRSATVVETGLTRLGAVEETVTAVGTTRAAKSINIVPTASGLVTRVAFEAGQRVSAGAVLVEIDSASERAAVRETESELVNLRAQMTRAESLRARKLLSEADVDELRGKLGMAEARLEAVRSQRDKRTLRAPFSGVVGLRNIDLGAYVDSGTVLTTLDDLNTVELEFKIPERYFSAVKIGQSISAASTAFPQRKFSGVVREVDTRIEATTRAFRVRAELPNPDAVLPEGLFMSVSLVVAERRNAVLAPEEAVIREGAESYVYVVAGGAAIRTPITVGQRRDATVEVRSGLKPEMEIVIKGQQSLRDKAPVRAAKEQTPGSGLGNGNRRQPS